MNDSFLATIAFALLGLFCLFLACLNVWIFDGHSLWAGYGALFSLLAMGLAYCAQHCFHFQECYGAMAREPIQSAGDPERQEALRILTDASESRGKGFQFASIAAAIASALFLWVAL